MPAARLFQTSTSASRPPAPSAPPAWTKSTATAASAQREGAACAARKVKPAALLRHLSPQTASIKSPCVGIASLARFLVCSVWEALPGPRPGGRGRKQVGRRLQHLPMSQRKDQLHQGTRDRPFGVSCLVPLLGFRVDQP